MPQERPPDPEEVIARFEAAPSELVALLAGVPASQLEVEAHAGGWTIAEVIHHISDGDDLWKAGILASLGDAVPTFGLEWYWTLPQAEWSECWHYASRAVPDSLALFRANRSITAAVLARSPRWWERQLNLKTRDGRLETIALLDVVASQADHAMQHILEIRKALAAPTGDEP